MRLHLPTLRLMPGRHSRRAAQPESAGTSRGQRKRARM